MANDRVAGESQSISTSLLIQYNGIDQYKIAYTNAIACAPIEESTLRLRPPSNEEINNCNERLIEFIEYAKPCVIVTVGAVAKNGKIENVDDLKPEDIQVITEDYIKRHKQS